MHLWRPWLLPLLYHALKGARDLYQRSAALATQTSPSLYRQEGEPIGGIEQCDGLHDGSIRRECKKLWKGSSVTGGPKFALEVAMLACLDFLFA